MNLFEEMARVERPPGSTILQKFPAFLMCSTARHVLLRKLGHNRGTHCRASLELSPGEPPLMQVGVHKGRANHLGQSAREVVLLG